MIITGTGSYTCFGSLSAMLKLKCAKRKGEKNMETVNGFALTTNYPVKINGYPYVDSKGNSWIIFSEKSNPKGPRMKNKWGCAEVTTGLGVGKEFFTMKEMIEYIEYISEQAKNILLSDSAYINRCKWSIHLAFKADEQRERRKRK